MSLSLSLSLLFTFIKYSFAQGWNRLESDHYVINFINDEDKEFANSLADKVEFYYRRIASELGYSRYSQFWTWKKKVKIHLYSDHKQFLEVTKQPKSSNSVLDYSNKKILSYVGCEESVFAHEIAHLIFRDFVGFKENIPLWVDDGISQWAEEQKRNNIKATVKQLYENDCVLSLKDMMDIDPNKIREQKQGIRIRSIRTKKDELGILLVSTDNLINTYYLEAVSLVGFLLEKYSSYNFADFCRQLRDGKSVEEALKSAYADHFSSLDEFERKWRKYLEETSFEE